MRAISTWKEEADMRSSKMLPVAILALVAMSSGFVVGAEDEQALIKSFGSAKVSLQQGLTAAAREGQPISAKFEMEDAKLQLSVYTAKDGKYAEVIVDYTTGTITKAAPITEGDDLVHAKSQSAAMAKAKTPLKDAVDKAIGQTSGARAVSVTPDLKAGHSVASIQLLKGGKIETVAVQLD